jgi:drug/metabolite transporter (DMT)-like permease
VVLVVIGVVVLVYQGFTYTTRETVLDIGPIHATADKQHNIPLSPVLGVMALVAGAALLVVGGRSV